MSHQFDSGTPKRVYKNYETSFDDLPMSMARDGVAVVPGVIPQTECELIRNSILGHFESFTKGRFRQNDKSTWSAIVDDMNPEFGVLHKHYNVGHMQPVWDLRQTPSVVAIFAKLWNVAAEDLISSFDGLSIMMPSGQPFTGPDNFALHLDQGALSRGLENFQGFITLYDVKEGNATLNVLEGSHKLHDAYFDSKPRDTNRFHYVEAEFFDACPNRYVLANAGDLVLWDSRTVHRGSAPERNSTQLEPRLVVYICLSPRAMATAEMIKYRIETFEVLRMTNHEPQNIIQLALEPESKTRPLSDFALFEAPVLTRLGKRLVGYE